MQKGYLPHHRHLRARLAQLSGRPEWCEDYGAPSPEPGSTAHTLARCAVL